MASRGSIEDRVERDLSAGRTWKARDRLLGHLRAKPADQWALNQLGEVYFRMGDLPQAGRYWFATERQGPEWDAAEASFYEQHGRRPQDVVAAIYVRDAIDHYPPSVQERLRTLQRRLIAEGRFWDPRARPATLATRSRFKDRLLSVAIAIGVLLFAASVLVGLYNIVVWIIYLVRGGLTG